MYKGLGLEEPWQTQSIPKGASGQQQATGREMKLWMGTFNEAVGIKAEVWYSHEEEQTDPWNREGESLETELYTQVHRIYDKDDTIIQWEGGVFSINGAGPIQYSYEKKHVSTPTSTLYTKSVSDCCGRAKCER